MKFVILSLCLAGAFPEHKKIEKVDECLDFVNFVREVDKDSKTSDIKNRYGSFQDPFWIVYSAVANQKDQHLASIEDKLFDQVIEILRLSPRNFLISFDRLDRQIIIYIFNVEKAKIVSRIYFTRM